MKVSVKEASVVAMELFICSMHEKRKMFNSVDFVQMVSFR